MKGTAHSSTADYLEFVHDGTRYRINLSWMVSNWQCLFGQGCPGHFPKAATTVQTDMGCCTLGCYITDWDNLKAVEEAVTKLTDEDWDTELQAVVRKKGGWKITYKPDEDGDPQVKSRVHEGGCVFGNRNNGSTGKPGCAFHHYAARIGVHYTEIKPEVCWSLPFRHSVEEDITILDVWDADEWGPEDEDGTRDSWLHWWCVDTPDAYIGKEPVYKYLEAELRKLIGDGAYDAMVQEIEKRRENLIAPMPGSQRNGGRPMLPLYVADRKPRR